jgi:hypothetical protein
MGTYPDPRELSRFPPPLPCSLGSHRRRHPQIPDIKALHPRHGRARRPTVPQGRTQNPTRPAFPDPSCPSPPHSPSSLTISRGPQNHLSLADSLIRPWLPWRMGGGIVGGVRFVYSLEISRQRASGPMGEGTVDSFDQGPLSDSLRGQFQAGMADPTRQRTQPVQGQRD